MARLADPATGAVVHVQGNLEQRYRARGWAEPDGQPKESTATPEEPKEEAAKPATRRNARRK